MLLFAIVWYFFLPVAEVARVQRGTAISAVYGTVRIEPAFAPHVRAQNSGFIQLAEPFSTGRGAIGKSVEKGQLLATIADETTARLLKQARADLQASIQRAAVPVPSSEPLKAAEDNLERLSKVVSSGNVPAVDYAKAKSEVNRLRSAVETERIDRDRNLNALEETAKKLEAQMKNSEVRAPIDGLLTNIQTIDGELVSEGNELFTVASRKNYVRGEVNEEDVGEVKPGMKAKLQLYAYRTKTFTAHVTSIQPAADPTRINCTPENRCDNEWSARRERQRNHDAVPSHCVAFFNPSQTGVTPQPERCRLRGRHFHLHPGTDPGLRATFHRFHYRQQRCADDPVTVPPALRTTHGLFEDFRRQGGTPLIFRGDHQRK